jgi:hypothetical protein
VVVVAKLLEPYNLESMHSEKISMEEILSKILFKALCWLHKSDRRSKWTLKQHKKTSIYFI